MASKLMKRIPTIQSIPIHPWVKSHRPHLVSVTNLDVTDSFNKLPFKQLSNKSCYPTALDTIPTGIDIAPPIGSFDIVQKVPLPVILPPSYP